MEKQRIITKYKSCRRLLILVFFCFLYTTFSFSQTLSYSQINALRISPTENQSLFTKTDIKFEVIIPKTKPNQIFLTSTNQRSDITFKTMRKSEYYDNDETSTTKNSGTLLEIWYNFEKPGKYTLTPIQVTINGRKRSIKFTDITVTDDPSKQLPRIVIKFENGKTVYSDDGIYTKPIFNSFVGQKINLTVYLQYSSQLINFAYDIPQDAIFTKNQVYEINELRYREKIFSHELIPVASFEWTSLAKGEQKLPLIKITATSYSGSRHDMIMTEIPVFFTKNDSKHTSTVDEHFFDSAFTQTAATNDSNEIIPISTEICQELANLYSKERNSIFSQRRIKKQRMNFELEHNLPVNHSREYSLNLLIGSLLIFIGSLILLFFSISKKSPIKLIICITLVTFSLVACIFSIVKHFEKTAICTGCTIHSIPEENAEAKAEMGKGNKVRITEKAGNWYYIELGETGGWCYADNLIIIK